MAVHSLLAKTEPAEIGRAARKARQWWAIATARACETMRRRGRGIRRIHHAGPMEAAAKPTCAAPAALACFTASQLISAHALRAQLPRVVGGPFGHGYLAASSLSH